MFTIKITSDDAPKAIGPYSPAISLGDFMYLSGQLPINPQTNKIESDDIKDQTKQVLNNIRALLNEVGLETRHIVKTSVYMTNLDEFDQMNEIYGKFFSEPYPARTCVQVARIPKDAKVEIECFVIDTLKYENPSKKSCKKECCDGCE